MRPILSVHRFDFAIMRIAAAAILLLMIGLLSRPSPAQATTSGIDLQILDSATEFGVPSAIIKWGFALSQSATSSSEGKLSVRLEPGFDYGFVISAPGYKPMSFHYPITSGSIAHLNINLDPVVLPRELRESTVNPKLRTGLELDHGYVSDALTHRPIAHVEVRLQQSGAAATTNSRGYFQMMAPAHDTSKLRRAEEYPPLDSLTASATGYKTYILTGLLHDPRSWRRFTIELTPGTGVVREDDTPVPLMPRESLRKRPAP